MAISALAKVNINTATAEAIVAYHTAHGTVQSVEDHTKVKGIGDKIIEKIKPERSVGE